ncbi:MAG: pyridoxamine 5'-phosphate oxidase family protein [Chloroflexota bacterium]
MPSLPPTDVRRADRQVDDEAWIRAFLHTTPLGFLATVHEEQPFLNSNLFVYDERRHVIYMHTANVGRTQANIAHYGKVCFSAATMGRLLPAKEALEFSVEYSSVVVFGQAVSVEDRSKLRRRYSSYWTSTHPIFIPERIIVP